MAECLKVSPHLLHKLGITVTDNLAEADAVLILGHMTREVLDELRVKLLSVGAKPVILASACALSGGLFGECVDVPNVVASVPGCPPPLKSLFRAVSRAFRECGVKSAKGLRRFVSIDTRCVVPVTSGWRVVNVKVHREKVRRSVSLFCGCDLPKALLPLSKACYLDPASPQYAAVLALELGSGCVVPRNAEYLRAFAAEISRVRAHVLYLAELGRAVRLHAVYSYGLRVVAELDECIRAAFGDETMTLLYVPGGVSRSVKFSAVMKVLDSLTKVEKFLALVSTTMLHNPASRKALSGIAVLTKKDIKLLGIRGVDARAAGVEEDLRAKPGYGAYGEIEFDVYVGEDGDALSRALVRYWEAKESIKILRTLAEKYRHHGRHTTQCEVVEGVRTASVEGAHSHVTLSVRVEDGVVGGIVYSAGMLNKVKALKLVIEREKPTLLEYEIAVASLGICEYCLGVEHGA